MQISHPPEYGEKRTLNALDYEVYHMNDSDSSKVRLHSHDFFEVFFLLSGVMDYIVEGSRYTLEPGSLLLIPPNELHRPEISTVSTFDRIVLWISPSYLSLLSQDIPGLFTELLSCSQLSHHLSPQIIPSPVIENTLLTLLHEHHNQEEGHILMRRLIISQFLLKDGGPPYAFAVALKVAPGYKSPGIGIAVAHDPFLHVLSRLSWSYVFI